MVGPEPKSKPTVKKPKSKPKQESALDASSPDYADVITKMAEKEVSKPPKSKPDQEVEKPKPETKGLSLLERAKLMKART
ncbi:hypothetical protein COB52_04185 [Candidatus Kaiserbacteria bacterium]|nr:MAG: hypothetical protein COB52_04185 [Candidatus Kaiserbacteria bacterium]